LPKAGTKTGSAQAGLSGGKEFFKLKKELIRLLCEKSFQYSKEPIFKLASGKTSRFYVNCKPVTLSPRGMFLIGHLVFEAIRDLDIQGVGGLTFGADPIAMAAAFVSELKKKPVKAFSIRKAQKDHGIIKWIEGDLAPGDHVAIVEDVVTTGGSTIKAIERARAEGLFVARVIVLIDRQEEGGLAAIQALVPDVVTLITRDELLAAYPEAGA
jgi:orotate phosphoribosyltransferase